MPSRLKRYQQTGQLHYITFTYYHRLKHLDSAAVRDVFEQTLERARRWYRFQVVGYVVMPEHVHLLMSEPERSNLATALQALKRRSSSRIRKQAGCRRVWQKRYYDFNVFSARKRTEKLRYMHRNPAKRGLVQNPDHAIAVGVIGVSESSLCCRVAGNAVLGVIAGCDVVRGVGGHVAGSVVAVTGELVVNQRREREIFR